MTRSKRTNDEVWAIDMLLNSLNTESSYWKEDPSAPKDRPDLTLAGPNGVRVACEITRVAISEWYQWQNDESLLPDINELTEYAVPREVDLWLERSIDDKSSNIQNYKINSNSNEVWLLVHGGMSSSFDFFVLDEDECYDIPLLINAAKNKKHNFDRIYIASSKNNKIICVFPFDGNNLTAPDITNPDILKKLSVRRLLTQTNRGVNYLAIGKEFKPSIEKCLPHLNSARMQITPEKK